MLRLPVIFAMVSLLFSAGANADAMDRIGNTLIPQLLQLTSSQNHLDENAKCDQFRQQSAELIETWRQQILASKQKSDKLAQLNAIAWAEASRLSEICPTQPDATLWVEPAREMLRIQSDILLEYVLLWETDSADIFNSIFGQKGSVRSLLKVTEWVQITQPGIQN